MIYLTFMSGTCCRSNVTARSARALNYNNNTIKDVIKSHFYQADLSAKRGERRDFMNTIIENLLEKAKENGWNYTILENIVDMSKYSPAGQEFYFTVCIQTDEENDNTTAGLFLESIKEYHSDYDPSYEAYLWLDETGHGKNGAPYDMKDLYNDMIACQDMVWDLFQNLHDYYYKNLYVEA